MPRQVQILLSRELFDRTSTKYDSVAIKAGKTNSSHHTTERITQNTDKVDALAVRILQVLEELRNPHCIMPFVIKGEKHIIIQFNSQQKHLGDTIKALQGMGVGIIPGTQIDINDLSTSITSHVGPKKRKKKLYKMSDRMTTEEIFESIDAQSHLTFDYILMTFVASLIAAVGLLTDSSVSVVASMLVSPLMGQILAVTWGITMRDSSLIWRGVRNESCGVLLCWLTGLTVGFCVGPFYGPSNLTVEWATGNLTSFEIYSRGSPWSLLSGGVVAVPSGIGVALALTGGGINALVGVAISAALLPPIVNSGLCLSLALWFNKDQYDLQAYNYFQYSFWSFLLFVVNFVLIIVLALSVFKLKKLKPNMEEKNVWQKRMSQFGSSLVNLQGDVSFIPGSSGKHRLLEEECEEEKEETGQENEKRISLQQSQSMRGHVEMSENATRISVGGTHRVENPLK
jgi:uncharacterized hydrophobic protein (TIGR00271 family)